MAKVRRLVSDTTVLDAIKAFIGEYTYSPSIRELSQLTLLSTATVHDAVVRLADAGVISFTPQTARSIVVTPTRPVYDFDLDWPVVPAPVEF